ITELVWISLIMQRVFKQNREAKILICGIVFSLLVELSFDFIILMGLSSNPPLLVHWGDIVLLTSISIVLALRYRGVYTQLQIYNVQLQQEITDHQQTELELQKYKRSLEDQVEERTRDLHQTNSQLIQEITEHKLSEEKRIELEKQLFQSQKMEAIGTLARGIAHDLNNSLGVMLGYTELLLDNQPHESEEKSSLEQVYLEGERAADLVQQILTFSRVYENELKLISIAPLLKESIKMMRTTLPPNIQINESFTAASPPILADATQLHQVIMNLCTNASHAMKEHGGVLDIRLEEVSAKAIQTPVPELMEGTYLNLSVSDTGCGMTAEVKERIFDPFFTTKAVGEGTGLGLSVVHGIVKNHNGLIHVDSTPGKGTTLDIYFPIVKNGSSVKIEEKDNRKPS
ncbi:MAG: ATP-binding protein, partial [bacterium]